MATALARNVYGSDRVTTIAYSFTRPSFWTETGVVVVIGSDAWPGRGRAVWGAENVPLGAGTRDTFPALSCVGRPRLTSTFAWATRSDRSFRLSVSWKAVARSVSTVSSGRTTNGWPGRFLARLAVTVSSTVVARADRSTFVCW